jgi:hypothetical protein
MTIYKAITSVTSAFLVSPDLILHKLFSHFFFTSNLASVSTWQTPAHLLRLAF